MLVDSEYICPNCGEEIVVPVDLSQGESQTYIEDCPVCCSPNVLTVLADEHGVEILAEAE